MVRHVKAAGPAVPYWDLVPVQKPTPRIWHASLQQNPLVIRSDTDIFQAARQYGVRCVANDASHAGVEIWEVLQGAEVEW